MQRMFLVLVENLEDRQYWGEDRIPRSASRRSGHEGKAIGQSCTDLSVVNERLAFRGAEVRRKVMCCRADSRHVSFGIAKEAQIGTVFQIFHPHGVDLLWR